MYIHSIHVIPSHYVFFSIPDMHPECTGYECGGTTNYCWAWVRGTCNATELTALRAQNSKQGATTCAANDGKHQPKHTAGYLLDIHSGSSDLQGKDMGYHSHNLKACTNECDTDQQCAPGLLCFQRDGFGHVWGCTGKGKRAWDYCYDPWYTTEQFYIKITAGTCADHGFAVVTSVSECIFAAQAVGNRDTTPTTTSSSNTLPEGCYSYEDGYQRLWLSTNKVNKGRGATLKHLPICRAGPGSAKFTRLSAPASKLSWAGRFHDPSVSSVLQLTMKPSPIVDETAVARVLDSSPWTCPDPNFDQHVLEHADGSLEISRSLVDKVRFFQGFLYSMQTQSAENGVL